MELQQSFPCLPSQLALELFARDGYLATQVCEEGKCWYTFRGQYPNGNSETVTFGPFVVGEESNKVSTFIQGFFP